MTKKAPKMLMGATTGLALLIGGAVQAREITVGYFLEWSMPFQYAKAMGVTVNCVSFDTGTAMSAAALS